MKATMCIGISLGSGGARGYAHIGVLAAIAEAGIPIDVVNGSSIGAIVAGAYALYQDTEKLIALAKGLVEHVNVHYFNIFRYPIDRHPFLRNWLLEAFCNLSALRESILSHHTNERALSFLFGEHTFAETKIPFSAVAFDLLSARSVVIKEGRLTEGILPSIAIPGIFPPVARGDRLLVDGGVLADVPVRELRTQGASFVIGVKLSEDPPAPYSNGFDLITFVDFLKGERLSQWELAGADFVVRVDLPRFDSMHFGNYRVAIERGYSAAKEAIPELLTRLDEHDE